MKSVQNPGTRLRFGNLPVLVAIAIGLAILLFLGTWQVNRLHWKENLIEQVALRLAQPVEPVKSALLRDPKAEYSPVTLSAKYLPLPPVFEFTTFEGASGWHVFSAIEIAGQEEAGQPKYTFVNRGYIPYDQRDAKDWAKQLPDTQVDLTGLLRFPLEAKPSYFVNANEPETGTFFWRDIDGMGEAVGLEASRLAPWYLDIGLPADAKKSEELPIAGTTRLAFPNNHLQYAVTWFGLAFALFVVGSYFLYARRNINGSQDD